MTLQSSFGFSVALAGDTLLAGAPAEASAAIGINGDFRDNSAANAGAVFAFDLDADCGVSRYGEYSGANVADLYSTMSPVAGTNFTIDLTELVFTGTAQLVISWAADHYSAYNGTILVDQSQSIFGIGNHTYVPVTLGVGQYSMMIPANAVGAVVYAQAGLEDPTQPGVIALTNGLMITVCP